MELKETNKFLRFFRSRSQLAVILVSIACFSFLSGFFYSYHLPKLKSWILLEIERKSQKELPVRVWPKDAEIEYFPLGITVKDIKLLPKGDLKSRLAPAFIKRVSVYLSIFSLLKGELRASSVEIDQANILFYDRRKTQDTHSANPKKQALPWLSLLSKTPIDSVSVVNSSVLAKSDKGQTAFKTENLNLRLENRFKSLKVNVDIPDLKLKVIGQDQPMDLIFKAKGLIEKSGIQITGIKTQMGGSFFVASGSLDGDTERFEFQNIELSSRGFVELAESQRVIKTYFPDRELPETSGSLGLETNISYDFSKEEAKGTFNAETKLAKIGKYFVGNTRLRGRFDQKTALIESLELDNPEVKGKLTRLKIENTETIPFSFQAVVQKLKFQKFAKNMLGLKELPVKSTLTARLPCRGQVKPKFQLSCEGRAASQNLHLYSENDSTKQRKTILKAKSMVAKGKVFVDENEVKYEASIEAGEKSRGSSSGTVHYEKGFNIAFKASRLDMADIENLADLRLDGSAVLSGSTKGTSKWGTFQMDLRAKRFWFEDYGFGQLNSKVSYKKGKLVFSKAKGQFLTSRYEGNVTVDFKKDQIFVIAKAPYLDLADLKKLFKRKYVLPVQIEGTGSGLIRAWGPFQINRMSFDVTSSFFRGGIAGESFDELVFNVKSKDGNIKTEQVELKKADSQIRVNGKISPDAKIDTVVVAKNFRLEQLELVSQLGLDIDGQLDATMSLKGNLKSPDMILLGRLRKVMIADLPAKDSTFEVDFLPNRLKGNGRLLGKSIMAQFSIPYSSEDSFDLDLKTQDLDFTSLFSLVSEAAAKKDFKSKLSTKVSLHSKRGGFWASSGSILIEDFELKQGTEELGIEKPVVVNFDSGKINTQDFYLSGRDSFFKLNLKDARKNSFTGEIDAKLNLNIVSILTPFLSDLRGRLTLSLQSKGPIEDLSLVGSSFIDKGFIKLSAFPHAFENLSADLLFNRRDILINALKANLGGGDLRAQGKVVLESLSKVPVSIKGEVEDITLNIPNGVKTKGSGRISFSGTKFPYRLAGNYDVSGGNVTMEFASEGQANADEIQPSQFLPKSIIRDQFQPISMNLDIKTLKPLSINNSLVQAAAEGELKLLGTPADMKLAGLIKPVPGGAISFRDTQFIFSDAFVEYKNDPPTNPTVYVSAEAKVTETTVNANRQQVITDYDIKLLAQGRTPDFNIQLDSQPPLSEDQIISLLALGVTTTTTVGNDSGQQDTNDVATGVIGTSLGARLLGNQLSEPLKERLGVDMTISTSVNADDNASYPKVILSKQWTPKWQLSTSRTIESNPKSDVRSQYKFNDNLSFIILWEGRENSLEDQVIQQQQLGADIEYRQSFK